MNMPLVLLNRRRRGGSFSPYSLFSGTAIGTWFDPSDVANLAWRRNLLTYSEQFDSAAWSKDRGGVSANTTTAPDGTLTADTLTATSGLCDIYQSVLTLTSGQVYTGTVYLKRKTGTGPISYVTLSGGRALITETVTSSEWTRVTTTSTASSGTGFCGIRLGTSGDELYIWGAQLELGTSATDYQRISDVNTEVIERFPTATMYQDAAGTTPVTTPGQPVGLRLDKSKGLVLGTELVTNGTFTTNVTGWTTTAGSFASQDERGRLTNTTAATAITSTSFSTVAGKTYQLQISVTGGTTAGNFRLGSTANGTDILATTGVSGNVPRVFVAVSTTTFVTLRTGSTVSSEYVDFDNISVRELAGNHAVAPTDAARPIYGVEPKGGRRNLLLATDTLATQSLTVTAVAHTLAFTGTGTVTLSGASTAGPLVGTGAGNRVSLTFTPTAASLTLTVSGSVTLGQLERASSATAYQKVVTAYDITESGIATCHYVQYDGSDDSMSTSAIDFTGTDKMSVFAGVRKLSDAAAGMLVELGATTSSNNGTFNLYAFTSPSNVFTSRGTIEKTAVASSPASPVSSVISGLSDISGDLATLRVNGSQVAQTTTDQGTGNYGNYSMFIGRRNNAVFPFNGKDYGIVIVGKAASAGEITDTETWLAAKTAQVTL